MDTFELDSDAFYICTEVSPRNFVVQKAIQIDKSQIERMVGKLEGKTAVEKTSSPDTSIGTSSAQSPGTSPSTSSSGASCIPQPPPLPYWFNRECKSTLMMIGPQPHGPTPVPMMPAPSNHFIPPMPAAPPLSREEIKQQLKSQLEYYFSRENLISDRYLKCQMDPEQFVSINVLASFPKIVRLTTDIDLIVEALKESSVVELDENFEKVRAITKRTTIIIREIPEEFRDEVVKLLADGPPFTELKYGFNDSWYVTYDNELDTQVAYVSVQHRKNEVTQKPVCARIKAGGPPSIVPPAEVTNGEKGRLTTLSNGETGTIQLRELGQTLADYGFVPVATYRPGEPILSHFEYITPTFRFSGNSLAYNPPMPPPQPLLQPQSQSQQFYYPSSLSTTPRNFDEMSTASSNSTRTTASNYNNRSGSRNGGGGGSYSNQYFESRSSFSNSNEWRARGGSGGRFQNNHNTSENNGRQNNGRGNWRGGHRGAATNTNGHHHQNSRQNGQQNNWRNEQNGHTSTPWWLSADGQSQNHRQHQNGNYNNRYNAPVSSSSSSSSSKYFSPDAVDTPINSGASTPPPLPGRNQQYNAPTPTDLPTPPVWPAPSFDRRRKSSEASSTTITTNTMTNTPSTPVTPPVFHPRSADVQEPFVKDQNREKTEANGTEQLNAPLKVEAKINPVAEKEKVRSPPAVLPTSPPVIAAAPSFAFEETAFPSLPKKIEPVKPPQKPTFSSVAAGRRNIIKQMIPEKKTSYAEKLKKINAFTK